MGSITMSGFNNIDWNQVLTAVMTQESQPLTFMQKQRTALASQSGAFGTLATRLGALETAATNLSSAGSFTGRTASSTDATVVSASAGSSALIGTYDVVVNTLARAQVTATTPATAVATRDTVVATGGSLTINGQTVTLTGSTTLDQLATAINGTTGIGVRATIISADQKYQLVLTGTDTGASHAFTVTNALAGSTLAFSATNSVNASDAAITVNNVRVTSATNTITDAVPGVTLTLVKQSTTSTVVSVTQDATATKDRVKAFVSAYNDLVSFLDLQTLSARNGDTGSIGRDAMLRSMRTQVNSKILASYTGTGAVKNLAEIGISFQRTGKLAFDEAAYDGVATTSQPDIEKLLAGDGTTAGVFNGILSAIQDYTKAGGLVPDATTRLGNQMASLDARISDMQDRLALRRLTLLKEYAAADQTISTLNSQTSSLSNLGSAYRLY